MRRSEERLRGERDLSASLLSVSTEIVQGFSHNRIPSMTDVCSNIMGASLGAALQIAMSKSSDGADRKINRYERGRREKIKRI